MAVRQTYNPNINIGARSGWCLQYVDDAISAPSRTPSARAAYINELNAGRIDIGHAPIGVWVVGFLGFSRGQYVEYGHVFLMRKRGDGSIEIHDSEVHAGRRGIYNSIEEIMGWFGVYGPDYLGFSYCCDGRQIAEYYDEIQPTSRKMEEDGNAREEPNTQSGVFQELTQGDVIAMKGYVTNGESIAGDTVWYVTARSGKYMSRQLFEDKELHDLPNLTPQTAPQPIPEPEQDFSNVIIDISSYQTAEVVNVFPKVAGVIVKAGWVGQQYGGNEFKLDPDAKLFVTKAREAGKMLGLYWLPYFSTREEAEQNAEYFVKCIEALGNESGELLFLDLEPDFEGTVEQISVFSNIVLQRTGKQVFMYAGEAIIQKLGLPRVDWYPNYGNPGNYAHGSLIHQYSETLTIPGYDGKLDANVSNKSIDELRSMGKVNTPKPPESPESPKPSNPDTNTTKPDSQQEKPGSKAEDDTTGLIQKLLKSIVKFLIRIFKGFNK